MSTYNIDSRKELSNILGTIENGDTVSCSSFRSIADSMQEFLTAVSGLLEKDIVFESTAEGIRIDAGNREFFLALASGLSSFEGGRKKGRKPAEPEAAESRYKGRKPIDFDEEAFMRAVTRWKNGEITAREAMKEVNLKPNTFYRRVKERNIDMSDFRAAYKENIESIREAEKQARADAKELRKQIRAEGRQLREDGKAAVEAAAEELSVHEVERENRHGQRRAEREERAGARELRRTVEAEAAELKKLVGSEEDK